MGVCTAQRQEQALLLAAVAPVPLVSARVVGQLDGHPGLASSGTPFCLLPRHLTPGRCAPTLFATTNPNSSWVHARCR